MSGEVKNYGVWVGTAISYETEHKEKDDESPHIFLKFTDNGGSKKYKAAINVKSGVKEESRLVFWIREPFTHPIASVLQGLDEGFHRIQDNPNLYLDYDRTTPPLLDLGAGTILEHDVDGPHNDIIDKLEPILDSAISKKATLYIFGSRFGDGKGIHEVHMNQGSLPKYDNAIKRDGGLLFRFPGQNGGSPVWKAVFLAFASQRLPTKANGEAEDESTSFVERIEG